MASSTASARLSVMLVWDFDWSLANENSDTWVVKKLGEELMPQFQRLGEKERLGWTQIVDRQMRSLWKKGVIESEIRRSIARLPVFKEMLDAVRNAAKAGASQAIVSDANKVFIEEFARHHDIHCFFGKGIRTNGAAFTEDGRLEVTPYHPSSRPPHGCSLCPPNMCKGAILDDLLSTEDGGTSRAVDKVIYVGDGGGDYCPALRLMESDLVLARDGEQNGRQFALRRRIEEEEGRPLVCRLRLWKNGADVVEAIKDEFKEFLETSGW